MLKPEKEHTLSVRIREKRNELSKGNNCRIVCFGLSGDRPTPKDDRRGVKPQGGDPRHDPTGFVGRANPVDSDKRPLSHFFTKSCPAFVSWC